jgi:hypothetical protein
MNAPRLSGDLVEYHYQQQHSKRFKIMSKQDNPEKPDPQEAARKKAPGFVFPATEETKPRSPYHLSDEAAARVAKGHREFFSNDARGK